MRYAPSVRSFLAAARCFHSPEPRYWRHLSRLASRSSAKLQLRLKLKRAIAFRSTARITSADLPLSSHSQVVALRGRSKEGSYKVTPGVLPARVPCRHGHSARYGPRPAAPSDSRRRVSNPRPDPEIGDRKSTRLNSSHLVISYAVFCLKKKLVTRTQTVPHGIASAHMIQS